MCYALYTIRDFLLKMCIRFAVHACIMSREMRMSELMQSENGFECERKKNRTIERLYICLYILSFAVEACGMRVKSTFRLIDIVSELWFTTLNPLLQRISHLNSNRNGISKFSSSLWKHNK